MDILVAFFSPCTLPEFKSATFVFTTWLGIGGNLGIEAAKAPFIAIGSGGIPFGKSLESKIVF